MRVVIAIRCLLLLLLTATWAGQATARELSAAELKRLHGVYHAVWKNKYKARVLVRRDGTLLARSGNKVDVGRWQVRGNRLCVAFRVWTRGRFKCGRVERQGRWYVGMRRKDGTPRLRMRR